MVRNVYFPPSLWQSLWQSSISRSGLIILNAWYGKFMMDSSQKPERARVIDVTVPLQCLVKDSKLILTEASKVRPPSASLPALLNPADTVTWTNLTCCPWAALSDGVARLLRPVRGRREESEAALPVSRNPAPSAFRRLRSSSDTQAVWVKKKKKHTKKQQHFIHIAYIFTIISPTEAHRIARDGER